MQAVILDYPLIGEAVVLAVGYFHVFFPQHLLIMRSVQLGVQVIQLEIIHKG